MSEGKPAGRALSQRVARKRQRNRDEILVIAQAILLKDGIEATTLAAVAGELGLTKQALYHYFPSKEVLVRSVVVRLLEDEIDEVIAAVDATRSDDKVLGVMMRAFYKHYIGMLGAFRSVYCNSQLSGVSPILLDERSLREEINPRTRHLFDVLEERMSEPGATSAQRTKYRRLAFSAWLAALGLLTMLSIADATNDPIIYSDKQLLDTLAQTFDTAAAALNAK